MLTAFNWLCLYKDLSVTRLESELLADFYFPKTVKNAGGPGQRSRYSDSLRAGRSGDRIPVGPNLFSAPVQIDTGAYQAYYTMGTGSFSEVKRPGRGFDHPSGAEVKERVELYLYFPSGPPWPVTGRTLPLPLPWIFRLENRYSYYIMTCTQSLSATFVSWMFGGCR
jgi:hypothetical protein